MGHATEGTLEHRLNEECFLCGHPIVLASDRFTFSRANTMAPELPAHRDCITIRRPEAVAKIYHQRVADLVDIPRTNRVQRYFRKLLLGIR